MTKLLPPDTSLKALAKLAGPIWIANIAIVGSGTIDTIMAGHLGKEHLAAIALGIATTISVLMGLVGVLMGLSPIAGHHFGARKFRAIGEELNQSFWLSLVLMAIGVPLLLNTDFWIELGGAKGEVADMAAQFIRWTAFALPASLLGRCFIALNAAVSRPRITMWVSLGMLALKAPLNAVFMYGWLGFPAMGGGGAGVSFFVLSWLSLFAFLVIWKFGKFYRPMCLTLYLLPLDLPYVSEKMEISRYGHCVSAKLLSGLIVGALSGLSAAAGVMVGKRLGRKEYDEAYTESKKIMYAGLAGAVAVSALLILLAGVYTGLYRVDGSVKELGRYC